MHMHMPLARAPGRQVEDSLSQQDPVKFALWSLDQDASSFEADAPASRMLEGLTRDIGLTPEQMGRLVAHRPAIREDRDELARCAPPALDRRASRAAPGPRTARSTARV